MHRTTCPTRLDMSPTSTIQYYREVSHAYSDSHLSTYGKLVTPRQTKQDGIRLWNLLFLQQIWGITLPKQHACSCGQVCWCPQCLLSISAGLIAPGMWIKRKVLAAIVSRTRCHDSATCLLCNLPAGTFELFTTDSLSPNMMLSRIGTPRCLNVRRLSMTCSVAVLAATCSEP